MLGKLAVANNQEPEYYGTLNISIIEGYFTFDTEIFGEMDPYIILEHNGVKYRTVTKKDAGKNPRWTSEEASYELKITSSEDTITFSAFD
jgi:hypothetical protein